MTVITSKSSGEKLAFVCNPVGIIQIGSKFHEKASINRRCRESPTSCSTLRDNSANQDEKIPHFTTNHGNIEDNWSDMRNMWGGQKSLVGKSDNMIRAASHFLQYIFGAMIIRASLQMRSHQSVIADRVAP
jgi:hypothetical protein